MSIDGVVPEEEADFLVYLLGGELVAPEIKQLGPHAPDAEFAREC